MAFPIFMAAYLVASIASFTLGKSLTVNSSAKIALKALISL